MAPYQHCVSGFFVKQEEAQAARDELIRRGIPEQQLTLYAKDPEDLVLSAPTDSQRVLSNILVDSAIGTAVGTAAGAVGEIALATTSVTLFVASPLIAPLAMLGWGASLGAVVGAVAGAIRFNKKDGKLAELVADAIQSGQVVLIATTHSELQTSVAIEVIQSAVGAYQDEARR
ncbi:MAG: hypothetical protein ACKOXU_08330 [Limnohabitans sp.]